MVPENLTTQFRGDRLFICRDETAKTRRTRGNKDGYSGAHVERFLGIKTSAVNRLAVFDELIRNGDEI